MGAAPEEMETVTALPPLISWGETIDNFLRAGVGVEIAEKDQLPEVQESLCEDAWVLVEDHRVILSISYKAIKAG